MKRISTLFLLAILAFNFAWAGYPNGTNTVPKVVKLFVDPDNGTDDPAVTSATSIAINGYGTSWATAYKSLKKAVAVLTNHESTGGTPVIYDSIFVKGGNYPQTFYLYQTTLPRYGVYIAGGFLTSETTLAQRNARNFKSESPTIIDGATPVAKDSAGIFVRSTNAITFDGFQIQNFTTTKNYAGVNFENSSSNYVIQNMIIRNNTAKTPTGNDNSGAGIYAGLDNGSIDIRNNTIYSNAMNGSGKGGSGITINGRVKTTIENCAIFNNVCSHEGAGILVRACDNNGLNGAAEINKTITIRNNKVYNNKSTATTDGGFSHLAGAAGISVLADKLTTNSTIATNLNAKIVIEGNVIANNQAVKAAGMAVRGNALSLLTAASPGRLTISNNIIWGNTTDQINSNYMPVANIENNKIMGDLSGFSGLPSSNSTLATTGVFVQPTQFTGNDNSKIAELLSANWTISPNTGLTVMKSAISFYPNPASDFVKVTVAKPTTVRIMSLNGSVIYSKSANSDIVIPLNGLSRGIYFIAMGETVEKLIVQ
jgi:hypothetical protein